MPTCAPNRNVTLPASYESSVLRPARDRDDVKQAWKRAVKQREQTIGDKIAVQQLTRRIESMRRRVLGGSGIDPRPPTLGGFKGEWSAAVQYKAGDIVLFTPAGGQAGAYGCAADPPIGTAPDTGVYWMAFPMQTPAVWA